MERRKILFFDIDNCLYSRNTKIAEAMTVMIDKYFETHLALSQKDAYDLHHKYYQEYGLAIDGLVRHHTVDPMDFNAKVDDALPLEDILKPDLKLRRLLKDIDTQKVKLWLLTNAYVTHGKRVVKLLGVDDLFEGITYCDYGAKEGIVAKPHRAMFQKAMKDAGADNVGDCYFVDDSYINAKGAQGLGWTAVHFIEPAVSSPRTLASAYQISDLEELRDIFPDFFKS